MMGVLFLRAYVQMRMLSIRISCVGCSTVANKNFGCFAAAKLKKLGQKKLTMEERKARRRALKDSNLPSFQEHIKAL